MRIYCNRLHAPDAPPHYFRPRYILKLSIILEYSYSGFHCAVARLYVSMRSKGTWSNYLLPSKFEDRSHQQKMFSSKADVTLISIYRIKFTTSLCVCVCVCIRLLAIVNYFLWFIHLERQAKKEIRTKNIQKDQLSNFLRCF